METLVNPMRLTMHRFFKDKKVLITGHTGFKGAWLSIWLRELGAVVAGYGLGPPTDPSLFQVAKLKELFQNNFGDIIELEPLNETFQRFEPEIVFHLAAQSLVGESYRHPASTYATNIMGTVNVLEACRLSDSVRCVVIVTSDKCYENRNWPWGYRENDRLGGKDPYSSSKACAEMIAEGYRSSFFSQCQPAKKGLATVRAGNVIGGGDWAKDRILPDCFKALEDNNPVLLRNPDAVRPWQHVIEPLHGYLLLANALYNKPDAYGGAWNFGPDTRSCVPVREIVEQAIHAWGGGSWQPASLKETFAETGILRIDSSKARAGLSWQPKWDYAKAVARTIQWYRKYCNGDDMYEACCEQLSEYAQSGSDDGK